MGIQGLDLVVETSNRKVLAVSLDENQMLTCRPLDHGTATIRIYLGSDQSISDVFTVSVVKKIQPAPEIPEPEPEPVEPTPEPVETPERELETTTTPEAPVETQKPQKQGTLGVIDYVIIGFCIGILSLIYIMISGHWQGIKS